MKRRLIRIGLGALGGLALLQAVRTWEAAGRDVQLIYRVEAPPQRGPLVVKLYGDEGDLLRRTEFIEAPYSHGFSLPDGDYRAECLGGQARFSVRADGPIEVRCDAR